MAQLSHLGPYVWLSSVALPPGGQHSWSWGPNPGFWQSGLVATAHPHPGPPPPPQLPQLPEQPLLPGRRLTVSMIQSHVTAPPLERHFVHVFVRNVGAEPVHSYSLWLTVVKP